MLRVPGWPTALAAAYAAAGHAGGVALLLLSPPPASAGLPAALLRLAGAVALLSHARVVAAVLVHDATHDAVFARGWRNAAAGTGLLWLAGTPYCYFPHVQKVHVAHHRDRADTVEFDYRAFVGRFRGLRAAVLALEWAFIPATELLMHARTALSPLAWPDSPWHRLSSCAGLLAVAALHWRLYAQGGLLAVAAYFLSTCGLIHVLSYHDCFAHTYTVVDPTQRGYRPGPADRTAAYEEANTYSTVLSASLPWLNVLTLQFGYHNAHHRSTGTPWYRLPALHRKLYGARLDACPQVLSWRQLRHTWVKNRLRRVLEEDYGCVYPGAGLSPQRVKDFVGSLGVSFLTV